MRSLALLSLNSKSISFESSPGCSPFLHPNSADIFLHSFTMPDEPLFELIASQRTTVARSRPVFVMSRFGGIFGNDDRENASAGPSTAATAPATLKKQFVFASRVSFNETKIRPEPSKSPVIMNTTGVDVIETRIEPSAAEEVTEETMSFEMEKYKSSLKPQNVSHRRRRQRYNAADIPKTALAARAISSAPQKPYVCEMCDKAFAQYGYLVVHRRSHSGERPYVCDVCEKRFTQSGNLTVHKRTHLAKKKSPKICYKCNKTFLRVSNFTKHVSVHFKLDPPVL